MSAWAVLGAGILLGGLWAYEELGWGGYWGWDPVENGSLMPWLTGTALIHGLLGWQHRGVLKKTVVLLAIVTFGLCNFATFLTRSGIFSSLHAFSESPIGWMFLALMLALAAGGVALVVRRRSQLGPEWPISTVVSREAVVLLSTVALLLLVIVMLVGTISVPLSNILLGRKITFGTAFYNNVLIPIALLLLAGTASAPLLRWGTRPAPRQRKALVAVAVAAIVAPLVAWPCGVRHPFGLAVVWLVAAGLLALAAALFLDAGRHDPRKPWRHLLRAAAGGRRKYAGFLIHVGFASLVVGVTGSSLGTRRQDVVLHEGETVQWAERSIRYVGLIERDEPDKFIAEADLEISQNGVPAYHLRPAQYLHRPQNQWSTEVAIRSTWGGDFYTILHGNRGPHRVSLTLVENPMMRWLWSGGWIALIGVLLALWPVRSASTRERPQGTAGQTLRVPPIKLEPPHFYRPNQPQNSARTRRRQ
jgi:cytochrome c-type biogenesis protein CcmF